MFLSVSMNLLINIWNNCVSMKCQKQNVSPNPPKQLVWSKTQRYFRSITPEAKFWQFCLKNISSSSKINVWRVFTFMWKQPAGKSFNCSKTLYVILLLWRWASPLPVRIWLQLDAASCIGAADWFRKRHLMNIHERHSWRSSKQQQEKNCQSLLVWHKSHIYLF